MYRYLLIIFFLSCSKEYSVETNLNGYDTTLFGNGNNSYSIKIPDILVGKKANINFYVTLYSTKTDSIGRNDYIEQLPISSMIKKFTGNPVFKNKKTISGAITLPDTLSYFSTTFYFGLKPVVEDTIRVNIVNIQ